MKHVKLVLGLALGFCLALAHASFAFASNEEMIEKQREIDQYIFEEHLEELEEMGIHVTHTSPEEDHVEIGISPYTEEHAAYLTEIFGEDVVKVVEGVKAVTLGNTSTELATGKEMTNQASDDSFSNSLWLSLLCVAVVAGAAVVMIRRNKKVA